MALTVLHSPGDWAARYGSVGRTVLSVGNFDGLHLGHRRILQSLVERARTMAWRPAVITFDPHPMRLLRPEQAPPMIQTIAQRIAGFEQLGLEAALVMNFDRALSQLSAEDFIERILVQCVRVGTILVGANFCFGHRGAGDVCMLGEYGKLRGFDVEIVPPVEVRGQVVSSTAVRTAVASGNVADAILLLGREFALTGEIRPGAGRGSTILFPTLNLAPEQELMPKLGVYATESVVGGTLYASVTNVGTRPTFNGQGVTIESHLLGFSDRVTSGRLEVRFHARLRDERKFSGVDALREQIARDILAAQEYFAGRGVAGALPGK